ncbi:MAG: DUF362 domain-containing protein [Phycisphaerae bacterium]|nr:DUF362 domain-containing protein [Phycisphaerae bacterium]
MPESLDRRQMLSRIGGVACGLAVSGSLALGSDSAPAGKPRPRVVIARDEAVTGGKMEGHRELLRKMLDASMQKLTGEADAKAAWRRLFKSGDRVGIKVNTLGLATQPVVVDAVVAGLRSADVPAENIIIWDRFDSELTAAGYQLNRSKTGVQCYGTDAQSYGSGYQKEVETNGRIGSCFSKIVAEQVDALVCVPVLKDHPFAGVTLGMKNFFGAIHNPNKYHEHHCDPYVADVVEHRFIRPRWRLTVCDGTRGQYNAGPVRNPGFAWSLGGMIVGTDFVAVDAVGADLLEQQRKATGMKTLAEEKRPPVHIKTAGARGLGVADLAAIERVEI